MSTETWIFLKSVRNSDSGLVTVQQSSESIGPSKRSIDRDKHAATFANKRDDLVAKWVVPIAEQTSLFDFNAFRCGMQCSKRIPKLRMLRRRVQTDQPDW